MSLGLVIVLAVTVVIMVAAAIFRKKPGPDAPHFDHGTWF